MIVVPARAQSLRPLAETRVVQRPHDGRPPGAHHFAGRARVAKRPPRTDVVAFHDALVEAHDGDEVLSLEDVDVADGHVDRGGETSREPCEHLVEVELDVSSSIDSDSMASRRALLSRSR